MKANEAPEKIYLFENPITETPDDRWLSKRSGENDIEYIQTNAFIKRACDAYCKVCKIPNCRSNECNFISKFKNYIKVE